MEKRYVPHGDIIVYSEGVVEEVSGMVETVQLVRSLGESFSIPAEIYRLQNSSSLRVLFHNASFHLSEFLQEYGELLGAIASSFPIKLHGLIRGLEEGEVLPVPEQGRTVFQKYNTNGQDFTSITSLCLEITLGELRQMDFLYELLHADRPERTFVAVKPSWEREPFTEGLFLPLPLCYFRYVPILELDGELFPALLNSLGVDEVCQLWVRFLSEGVSCEEFEQLFGLLGEEVPIDIYPWEIALHLAMEELGLCVDQSSGFVILDQRGKRRSFDYHSSSAAERLFLKFLFPTPTDPM